MRETAVLHYERDPSARALQVTAVMRGDVCDPSVMLFNGTAPN